MKDYLEKLKLRDNGGRRFLLDRRQFFYTMHFPERRNGIDRRNGRDRRKSPRIN
jgi:hypothetical protein